jgi:hypothetical protein
MRNVTADRHLLDRRARQILATIAHLPPDLALPVRETADIIGTSPSFLNCRRCVGYGTGPAHFKLGGAVRYRVDSIRRWLRHRAAIWDATHPPSIKRKAIKAHKPRAPMPPPLSRARVRLPSWAE